MHKFELKPEIWDGQQFSNRKLPDMLVKRLTDINEQNENGFGGIPQKRINKSAGSAL